ncbi:MULTISPECIES: AAA family ATPase [Flavobacterium]|uniref:AAA family ATPase n=1 Tax=Flavobacterium TaxID=237 RepID=UPI0021157929|nr:MULTISPECIES: AAA family ATPase [Flavobacterium]UUF13540.1 hypothetical protein NLJ00_19995 [Flavobacterium panici]
MKFNFPKIESIVIKNFSLYSIENVCSTINENFDSGVYCLAGANGLGKTTFLSIINYALTGIVLEPNKNVLSPDEIIKLNKSFTERYFKGRIKAEFSNLADVELSIKINNKYIRIVRGFSNRDELKSLKFYKKENNREISLVNTDDLDPKELLNLYESIITKETSFGKFNYFLFYQLYVLTFDENKKLLFWDERAANNALSIAFNDDLENTDRLLSIKRDMDKHESDGRNARWQATQLKKQVDELLKTKTSLNSQNYDDLKKEYDELINEVDEHEKMYGEINNEYDVLLKRQNIINAEILNLKTKYKKLFSEYSEPRSKLLENPTIKLAKANHTCFMCGAHGQNIIESIERKLYNDNCPACDTKINNEDTKMQESLLDKIKQIDKELILKSNFLEEIVLETETKKLEFDKITIQINSSKQKLDDFLKSNSKISFSKTGNASIDVLIENYEAQFKDFDKKSKDSYTKRDNLQPEYDNLLKRVDNAYKEAEELFVPLFKELAKSFIGLDLNVYSDKKGRDFILYFEMNNSARTSSFQLSESQRFFLDIALRMALTIYLSSNDNPATMLIDTPEGSLDIAYENRVGKMFAKYIVEHGQNIIMTANINASRLLISLAEECTESKMKFRRMLEWTELNSIQKEGEHLFTQVFTNIESALKQ